MSVLLLLALTALAMNPPLTPQTFSITDSVKTEISYLISLPEGYEGGNDPVPIMIFLHGAGERGTDLNRVRIHGPGREITEGRKYPFIVVVPQCPEGKWWDVRSLARLLDDLEKRYRVDKDREYLTGLSMGGYGTWEWAGFQPERFAAIAPVCGGGSRVWIRDMKSMPILCVHGDADPVVRFAESEWMTQEARAHGCQIRFQAVLGGGHDVWTQFYDSDDWWQWMLKFKCSDRAAGKVEAGYVREDIRGPADSSS